jgi:CRISPR system Cascade subunit CasA
VSDNLMADPVLPILTRGGDRRSVDLPTLLELYARDEVAALPFLRPHHQAPFHAFLAQVGALAVHRANETGIERDAEDWRGLLRRLTPESLADEAWRLVVDDLSKPAFMQPPVGGIGELKNEVGTPDDLDVLVTSKNHGVKQGQAAGASLAEWAAALVALQTTGGFMGAGNYGVARMNGGFATRPFVGLVPEGGPGARWRRDVRVMLQNRAWFFDRVAEFAESDGAALLWCRSWDGTSPLLIDKLDPWFVEVCRRVRLVRGADGRVVARAGTSSAARIAAGPLKGNVGDPWTPVRQADGAAYNSTPRYGVMSEVLFDAGTWVQPLLLRWHDGVDRAPVTARFDVLVRGQGKTEGHHVREVRMDKARVRVFARAEGRDRLAVLAKQMISDVEVLLGRECLRRSLLALIQGAPIKDEKLSINYNNKTSNDWVGKFTDSADRIANDRFFDILFERAEAEESGQSSWRSFLRELAGNTFAEAVAALPTTGPRRLRAIVVAEDALWGAFGRKFPEMTPQNKKREKADAA